MLKYATIKELFNLDETLAKSLLESRTWPWSR